MKDTNFVYWLQGYLELSEPTDLSEKVVVLIKKHLQIVLENTDDEIEIPFIFWLDGFLAANGDNGLNTNMLKQIEDRIYGVFKHVIDPQTSPGLQGHLNNLHGNGSNSELMRC